MASEIKGVSSSYKFIWKIENFSETNSQVGLFSDVFFVGAFKWRLRIYPKGVWKVYDHLSVFLWSVGLTQPVNMQFSFEVTSQTDCNNTVRHHFNHNFSEETNQGWGSTYLMRLSELHDPAKGYLVNDTCVIEAEATCRLTEDSDDDDDETPKKRKCIPK